MKKTPKKSGPEPFKVDWAEFDKLCSYHCTQREVADFFGISVDTLDRACEREKGVKLADLWEQKKGGGRAKLKKLQWTLASQGSTGMAIFLGKQLLNQTDKPADQQLLEVIQKTGLTKDQAVQVLLDHVTQQSKLAVAQGKKSFEQFCADAGYPKPFARQLDMRSFFADESEPRLLLGARGYGKTDYITILGVAYDVYLNPLTSTTLIMTKSTERNTAIVAEIAEALKKNGVALEKENASCVRASGLHGKDNSVSAVTIRTASLRGRHPQRVVMDDPVTEDDTSDATRRLVKKKYNEAMKLCSNVLIIGQPAHKYDLYAELRGIVKTLEVPWGDIPELSHDLAAQRAAGVDESSIQASYFLKIMDEGQTPFDKINYLDAYPPTDSSVAFIDPSHKGGDYTALTILTGHFSGVAVVGFTFKKAWNHCLDDIAPLLQRFNVGRLAFETNSLGDMPLDILRQVFPGVGIVGKHSTTNKHSRIMAAGAFAHLIHLSKESDKKYIEQVTRYEYNAEYDDAPDSLACCLEWVGLVRGVQ